MSNRHVALALFTLATACSAAPAPPPPTPPPRAEAVAAPLAPARWALFDRLGTMFDEAGQGSALPRSEHAIVDGVRVVVHAGVILAHARHADRLSGFRSLPERLGGGFVLWSEDRVYRAADFLGELSAIADVGATGGARPWLSGVLLRTPAGLVELDPRTLALRRAAMPGVADALALDARRAVRLDALGRASITLDAGASWTDVLATRGVRVRALGESPTGEIVLTTDTSLRLALGKTGALYPLPEVTTPPAEPHSATPSLGSARPVSSRTLPGELLAYAVAYGALLPGGRIVVARENGVRVLATETGLPVADADLLGVDPRFSRCQAVAAGTPQAILACIAETGATVIDLDGPLARPALEATFPAGGGGFSGGPRGRLAFDGRCGPEPPASTDLGPGTARTPESSDEGQALPAPAPAPEPAGPSELPSDDDARVCVRAAASRWVERRLRGEDARRLYRWVPGDDGTVTALVLAGSEAGDAGAPAQDGGSAAASPRPRAPPDGVRVIRIDPEDSALAGGAFPAVPPPQKEMPHRSVDASYWQDDDGSIRGWIRLPAEGEEKVPAPPSAQGPAHRVLPVATGRGGRAAGVRIDAGGHVTVYALPKGVVEVVYGGRFGLAMATGEAVHESGSAPGTASLTSLPARAWFETLDGGASWAAIEGPPVGGLEPPADENAVFACSPIGCAWASGMIRLGWGGGAVLATPELRLTAAASPPIREPEPLAVTCRFDASPPWVSPQAATPAAPMAPTAPKASAAPKVSAAPKALAPKAKAPAAPQATSKLRLAGKPTASARPAGPAPVSGPPAPIALRLPATTVGVLREHAWTGEVLPPFQPSSAPRRLSATDRALNANLGSVVPILGSSAGAPVDLLLLVDRRRLRAGGAAASFLPFEIPSRPTIAADGSGGSLVLLDADRGSVWLSTGDATAAALHLLRVPDVSRSRLTLARRLAGGGLALAGYSTSTGDVFAGDLDLGRAEVGSLTSLGRLEAMAEAGACAKATHRLLVELPVKLRIVGRAGEVAFDQQVTASFVIVAGGDRVCIEAMEAVPRRGDAAVLRATLGPGGSASVWSAAATARGTCAIQKR